MIYTPTEWHNGDVITAEKLNNIETAMSKTIPVIFISSNRLNGITSVTIETETGTKELSYDDLAAFLGDNASKIAIFRTTITNLNGTKTTESIGNVQFDQGSQKIVCHSVVIGYERLTEISIGIGMNDSTWEQGRVETYNLYYYGDE